MFTQACQQQKTIANVVILPGFLQMLTRKKGKSHTLIFQNVMDF